MEGSCHCYSNINANTQNISASCICRHADVHLWGNQEMASERRCPLWAFRQNGTDTVTELHKPTQLRLRISTFKKDQMI